MSVAYLKSSDAMSAFSSTSRYDTIVANTLDSYNLVGATMAKD